MVLYQLLRIFHPHTDAGQLHRAAELVLGAGFADEFGVVVPDAAVDADEGPGPQLLQLLQGLGTHPLADKADLALYPHQVGVIAGAQIDHRGIDARIGGAGGLADADDGIGLAGHGKLHLLNGGLVDLIRLEVGLHAQLGAGLLQILGSTLLVGGAGDPLIRQVLYGLPGTLFADRHINSSFIIRASFPSIIVHKRADCKEI